MILDSYIEDLEDALDAGDRDKALDCAHDMIQRDPLDQQGLIAEALELIQEQWPELSCDPDWDSLPGDGASADELEVALGSTLQLVHKHPTMAALTRIGTLAQRLVDLGELEAATYPKPQPTAKPSGAAPPSADRSDDRTIVYVVIAVLVVLAFAFQMCTTHTHEQAQSAPGSTCQ